MPAKKRPPKTINSIINTRNMATESYNNSSTAAALLLYMDINLGLSAPSQVVSIVAYSSSSSSCFPTKADLMTSTLCRHSHNTKPVYHSLAQNRISALFSPLLSVYVCVCVFRLFCLKAKFIVKVATAAAAAAASATAAAPTKTFVIRQKS